jgi:hypothetical protein
LHLKWKSLFAGAQIWRAVGSREANTQEAPSSRPTSKILCPALTYVIRRLPSCLHFTGLSRKKLLAWPATQMQSGGGISDTGNQHTVDGDIQRARWPTYMRSTGLLWKRRKCSPVVALSTPVTNRQSMAIFNALDGRPICALTTTWLRGNSIYFLVPILWLCRVRTGLFYIPTSGFVSKSSRFGLCAFKCSAPAVPSANTY